MLNDAVYSYTKRDAITQRMTGDWQRIIKNHPLDHVFLT